LAEFEPEMNEIIRNQIWWPSHQSNHKDSLDDDQLNAREQPGHVFRQINSIKMKHVFLTLICTAFAQLYTFENSNVVLINGSNFDS
jgi:hypothetical protein